jgi:sarcosine oxidase subunit beta
VALQAMVTEPVKPIFHGLMWHIHVYVSQSDRVRSSSVAGRPVQFLCSAAARQRNTRSCGRSSIMPVFGRLRMMRQWAGICDMSPDVSPIVGRTDIENLFVSTGWGTGGYKAIPAGGDTLAYTIVNDHPHHLLEPFQLERFSGGRLIDEGAASGVAH